MLFIQVSLRCAKESHDGNLKSEVLGIVAVRVELKLCLRITCSYGAIESYLALFLFAIVLIILCSMSCYNELSD